MKDFLFVDHLCFTYPNSTASLFDGITFQLNRGWVAIVGPNGSGKTTLLKLICGILKPDSGSVDVSGLRYYAEQRTDSVPPESIDFLHSTGKPAHRLKASLEIGDDWVEKWDHLSHGERKRFQIATALFTGPTVLAIDEPSNHLDLKARQVLLEALKDYKGIGLLVSHDRELMDTLCRDTFFIDPPRIDLRRGAYTQAACEREKDNQSRIREHELAGKEVKKLRKKAIRQKEKVARTVKLDSKRHIRRNDHDAKAKKDLGRLTGKDAVQGRIYKRIGKKLEKARELEDSIDYRKNSSLGIQFHEEQSRRFFPLIIPSGTLMLGNIKSLNFPELTIQSGEKIGLFGNNGSGKSTFLSHLMASLDLPTDRLIFIPQEIPAWQSRSIIDRVHQYNRDIRGQIMILISRLGSEAYRLLETDMPSPGEVRKLLLAEAILKHPAMIIMDEPTNHMDLPSIECVEQALTECKCTQILVSHDRFFLKNIAGVYWKFKNIDEIKYYIETGSGLE